MRISTSEFNNSSLNNILNVQQTLSQLDLQLSTGNRVNEAGDDPVSAATIFKLSQNMFQTNTYSANADFAKTRLSLENDILQQMNNLMAQAKMELLKANSAGIDDAGRASISTTLSLIRDQLVDLANTQDGTGEYIFAGFFGSNVPFTFNATGGVSYNGSMGQRFLQIGNATNVAITESGYDAFEGILTGNGTFVTMPNTANTGSGIINRGEVTVPGTVITQNYTISFLTDPVTGLMDYTVKDSLGVTVVPPTTFVSDTEINFDGMSMIITGDPALTDTYTVSPSTNESIFATIENAINALNQPNPAVSTSMVSACLQNMQNELDNINSFLTNVGSRINVVKNTDQQNSSLVLGVQQNLSDIQNADLAQIISSLVQQTVSLQAAYSVYSKMGNMSLFSFMS